MPKWPSQVVSTQAPLPRTCGSRADTVKVFYASYQVAPEGREPIPLLPSSCLGGPGTRWTAECSQRFRNNLPPLPSACGPLKEIFETLPPPQDGFLVKFGALGTQGKGVGVAWTKKKSFISFVKGLKKGKDTNTG